MENYTDVISGAARLWPIRIGAAPVLSCCQAIRFGADDGQLRPTQPHPCRRFRLHAGSRDIVELDLGTPAGSEAGLRRPAIVITAQRILKGAPNVIHVVPLTRTIRRSSTEVLVEPDAPNRLTATSAAQCQHVRLVATSRIVARTGRVGPVILGEVRETLALILDL